MKRKAIFVEGSQIFSPASFHLLRCYQGPVMPRPEGRGNSPNAPVSNEGIGVVRCRLEPRCPIRVESCKTIEPALEQKPPLRHAA